MRSRLAVAGALGLFWGLVLLGGALEPGYSHTQDFISRLASFGATRPFIGIAAIAALALAHAAAGFVLHRVGARTAGAALGAAALAGLVVATFRVHCPHGAAGCRGRAPADDRWTDVIHAVAVTGYEAALLAAMLALAWWGSRRRRAEVTVVSLIAAVGSLVTVLGIEAPAAGAEQRLWLAVSTGWLLWIACRRQHAP